MDFFSKVGEKATETFQSIKESETTKKAINYAGIPGLQMKIGKCESELKNAYAEIGKAYYEAHREEDGDFSDQYVIIRENLRLIGEYKAEIEERKSGETNKVAEPDKVSVEKICPICNHSVPQDSAFCSVCGHQF